jgi:hypothetical protein
VNTWPRHSHPQIVVDTQTHRRRFIPTSRLKNPLEVAQDACFLSLLVTQMRLLLVRFAHERIVIEERVGYVIGPAVTVAEYKTIFKQL